MICKITSRTQGAVDDTAKTLSPPHPPPPRPPPENSRKSLQSTSPSKRGRLGRSDDSSPDPIEFGQKRRVPPPVGVIWLTPEAVAKRHDFERFGTVVHGIVSEEADADAVQAGNGVRRDDYVVVALCRHTKRKESAQYS